MKKPTTQKRNGSFTNHTKSQTLLVLRLIHHRFTHIPPMWRQIWALRSDLMLFAAVNVNYQKITHAHAGLITRKFHGSFRKIFYSFLCLWIKNFLSLLPYRYFYQILVLYQDFSGSRQIGLLRFPPSPWSLTPLTSTDYSSTGSVYYSPITRPVCLNALWWYAMRLSWGFSSSGNNSHHSQRISLPGIPGNPISIPHSSAWLKNHSSLS